MASDHSMPGPPLPQKQLRPPDPGTPLRVVLAIGLPGSGKSTWFSRQGVMPLSSDNLRLLLADDENEQRFQADIFRAMNYLLRLRLDLGRPVTYLDATNLLREFRRSFVELAHERGCILEAVYFEVPLEICLQRNAARQRQVPEDVMRLMAEKLEPPTLEEGFQRIVVVGEQGETRREIAA